MEVVLNKCKLKDEEVESLKAILNDHLLKPDSASSANTAKIIKNLTSEISQLKIQKQNIMYEKFDEKKAWEMSSYKLKEQVFTSLKFLSEKIKKIPLSYA